ncbi:MAG: hypothetical protein WBA46_14445 [Thermomicrobiales bacterium]
MGINGDQIDELISAVTGLLLAFGGGIAWLSKQRQEGKARDRANAIESENKALKDRNEILEEENQELRKRLEAQWIEGLP